MTSCSWYLDIIYNILFDYFYLITSKLLDSAYNVGALPTPGQSCDYLYHLSL